MSQATVDTPKKSSLFSVPPALRYPAFRAYWLGTLASVSGFQMFQFGQLWLAYEITGSPLFLGFVGLANAIPAIALNLFGGVFADLFDKRRLIRITQLITAALIILLAVMTMLDAVHIYNLLIIAFFAGAVNAFDQPARQALYPHLIDRKVMLSAVAMNSAIWQGTRIVAPAAAGAIIGFFGTSVAFFLAGAGFVTMALVISALRIPPIKRGGSGNAAKDMLEGVNFIAKNSIFSFLIGMTFFNSFFGLAYIFMMPIFAVDILKVGAEGQGVLMGVSGAGALVTTLLLGSLGNIRQKGLMLIGGAIAFGIALVAFALAAEFHGSFILALGIIFFMGVFNSIYMVSIMSSLQIMVPDNMRGRVMGFYGMTWSIMPLGGFQAGIVAQNLGAPFAVSLGGLAVAAFAAGPAMLNAKVRNIGAILQGFERAATEPEPRPQTSAGDG
ncbi:MAG: MFS transporter [Chloroflexi bacterium]|nr:MFS transporter [Chloroflexota bacterium]MCI0813075.1 MFS transporter [Chloroflexota bacterium]MCI0822645.1 MFS transporter [Chloroflexota bacterium]MCI0840545.1 MFS transporter [Chloroflexota bacterium]MCI0868580.1 MFS transporter [Chloroflexota bacterium]